MIGTVVVTHGDTKDELATLLRAAGARVMEAHVIETVAAADRGPLDAAFDAILGGAYDVAAFTSKNGVRYTFGADRDCAVFGNVSVAAIGTSTAAALARAGRAADIVAEDPRGEGLAAAVIAIRPRPRVVHFRAKVARDAFADAIALAGGSVDPVVVYEARRPSVDLEAVRSAFRDHAVDAVTFTAPSSAENLVAMLGPGAEAWLARVRIACIGPVTAAAVRSLGLPVCAVASAPSAAALASAVVRVLGEPGLPPVGPR